MQKISLKQLICRHNKILSYMGILILFIVGIILRSITSLSTPDMSLFFIPWYDYIRDNGVLSALSTEFSNYTPLYTYLLAITTLSDSYVPKITAIKFFPILADFVMCMFIYKIVRLKYTTGYKPFLAAGIFLLLPTIFVNSAFWGQIDSLWTVFLVISLYFVMKDNSFLAMLAFGFAFSIKFQAIFFAPFIAVLILKKKVNLLHLLIIPGIYLLLSVPVVLLGRNIWDVLTIYVGQSGQYHSLSSNGPTLYSFISNEFYEFGLYTGLFVAFIGISIWILKTSYSYKPASQESLVLSALISVSLLPFLLPKMHERYFYSADVFSLLTGFFIPELWFLPVLFQVISGLSYTVFLLGAPKITVKVASLINALTIIFLLIFQFSIMKRSNDLNSGVKRLTK